MMDVKINKNRHRARNRTRASCDFNQRPHGFQRAGNFDFRYGSSSTSFQAQAAHFPSPPIPDVSLRRIARRPNRLTRDEARRFAVNRQVAGAAAPVAADERGVTRSQPQIHDSPRNVR
jgi:hypothetical protein